MNTQNLPDKQLESANSIRDKAMGILGFTGVPFVDLTAQQKRQVSEKTAQVILETPSNFTEGQVAAANGVVNREGFGQDYDDSDQFSLFDAALTGAREGFSSTVSNASDIIGSGVGAAFKASPIFSILILAAVAGGAYIVLKK